jgi:hypothetical protein
MFQYPAYLDHSVISDLENLIIEICNTCPGLDQLVNTASPVYEWAGKILHKTLPELRHEIESHEADEHFPNQYMEEKDHLLKLPLILLEHINNR